LIKRRTIIFCLVIIAWSYNGWATPFDSYLNNNTRFMVALDDGGNAEDFLEYAENILKRGIKSKGGKIINPELMKKVKADKLLWQAIQNGNATAMAKISTDYGAQVLITGELAVESREKFGASYEGVAVLNIQAVDTTTAEEVSNVYSLLMGTLDNPAPIEDSPLLAKQMAVQKACEDVLFKLGLGAGSDIRAAETYSFDLHDIYETKSGKAARIAYLFSRDEIIIGAGRSIELIMLYEQQPKIIYDDMQREITAVAVSPNDRLVAAGDKGGHIVCIDLKSNNVVFQAKVKGPIQALAYRPDSGLLAAADGDHHIHCYSTGKGIEVATLKGHRKRINSISFTPDARHLVSASNDLSIRWWDINVGRQKKAFNESTDKLLSMALSSDGTLVATSIVTIRINLLRRTRTDHRKIIVRNTVTGEEVKVLEGHKEDIHTLSFHPAKRFLGSGADDRTVKIWDLQKGEVVSQLKLSDSAYDMRFSPRRQWLAVATRDGSVTVWKLR